MRRLQWLECATRRWPLREHRYHSIHRSDPRQPAPFSRLRTDASGTANLANSDDCFSPRRGAIHPVPEAVDCVTGYMKRTIHFGLRSISDAQCTRDEDGMSNYKMWSRRLRDHKIEKIYHNRGKRGDF